VRGALAVHPTFEAGMHSMQGFFQAIQANPPGPPPGAKKPGDDEEAALAAAVAAAVAAAGPVPAQQAQAVEVPAGRGAEGALGGGLWGAGKQAGGRPGAAATLALYDMWKAKPLGQARVAAAAAPSNAAAAGLGQWSNHQQGPATAAAAAAVAGAALAATEEPAHMLPHHGQHRQPQQVKQEQQPMQQQQQQAQPLAPLVRSPPPQQPYQYQPAPGFYARPRSAEQAPPPDAAGQLAAALQQVPISAWARQDLNDCLAYLQGNPGGPGWLQSWLALGQLGLMK
jgi:hypothetical protein